MDEKQKSNEKYEELAVSEELAIEDQYQVVGGKGKCGGCAFLVTKVRNEFGGYGYTGTPDGSFESTAEQAIAPKDKAPKNCCPLDFADNKKKADKAKKAFRNNKKMGQ